MIQLELQFETKVRPGILAMLLLFFVAALGAPQPARANNPQAGADSQTVAARLANQSGPGMDVAIADFDGDLLPDSAHVNRGNIVSGSERYSIDFHFAAQAPQSFQVEAPGGGLRIEARDVNGDHAIDLILTTAWLRQPVAILLNDGHGNFSRTAPSTYPDAFRRAATALDTGAPDAYIPFALAPRTDFFIATAHATPHQAAPAALGHVSPSTGFRAGPFLASAAGRAPPSSYLA